MKTEKIVIAILAILLAGLTVVNIWQGEVIADQRESIKWLEKWDCRQ